MSDFAAPGPRGYWEAFFSRMAEEKPDDVLTLKEVAQRLRCSKAQVSLLLRGDVNGLPTLTHFVLGRRKVVLRKWLYAWLESHKRQ